MVGGISIQETMVVLYSLERERVSGEKERKSDWCLVVLHCI